MNKGQSTNDSYPTSAKLACILMHSDLLNAIKSLEPVENIYFLKEKSMLFHNFYNL